MKHKFTSYHTTNPWTDIHGIVHGGTPFSMTLENPTIESLAHHYEVAEDEVDIQEVGENEISGYDEGDEVVKVRGQIVGKIEWL